MLNLQSRPLRSLSLGPGILLAVLLALGTPPLVSVVGRAAEVGSTNAPNPLLTVERIFMGGEFAQQRTGLMMAAIYQALLTEIQRDGAQKVLISRTSLTPLRKFWLAWLTYLKN